MYEEFLYLQSGNAVHCEAMAMFPLPPRRMSRTDPIFLPPIVVDDSDDDAIMAVGSAASLSGFSLEFFEQPPPDSPMDWTLAAQPSTGEISAALRSRCGRRG